MKIIFLNVWGGRQRNEFVAFLKEHIKDTDVFCFQEANERAHKVFGDILSGYQEVFAYKNITGQGKFSQSTYVRSSITLSASSVLFETTPKTGLVLYTKLLVDDQIIHVCNVHGIAQPPEKLDTPERVHQSATIVDFLKDKEGAKIVGGDFNILPDTASMKLFSQHGYHDLVKDFDIATTRNRLAWERYPENIQYYSDYLFTSLNVHTEMFLVPSVEISDHLPLIATFGF
jgi:endonuclease/exonuclease/phosphatase family metal-dependent hydrolase